MLRPALSLLLLCCLSHSLGCGASPASDDPAGLVADTTERGAFRVAVEAPEGGFRRGLNSFSVVARDDKGRLAALTEVVARMPAHTHVEALGVTREADGRWHVDGLVLPMPGRWEITLHFALDGARDEALLVTRLP